jgi:hypothetical protein
VLVVNMVGCRRLVYAEQESVVMAVEVQGAALLDWVAEILNRYPYFYQTFNVTIARDKEQQPICQVNSLQVATIGDGGTRMRVLAHGHCRHCRAACGLLRACAGRFVD